MATRPETAAAVKEIVAKIEALELENLKQTDLEAIVGASQFKQQEVSYTIKKRYIDEPPVAPVPL